MIFLRDVFCSSFLHFPAFIRYNYERYATQICSIAIKVFQKKLFGTKKSRKTAVILSKTAFKCEIWDKLWNTAVKRTKKAWFSMLLYDKKLWSYYFSFFDHFRFLGTGM